MKPGTKVGASRWPGALPAQPWMWGKPWAGKLLAVDDPRAWKGSIAFGPKRPSREAVRAHVEWCRSLGLLDDSVPVLWDFGPHGKTVMWEKAENVRAYAEDVEAWETALAEAWARHRESEARRAA